MLDTGMLTVGVHGMGMLTVDVHGMGMHCGGVKSQEHHKAMFFFSGKTLINTTYNKIMPFFP
jgi:hypothetical protein